jgi:hypothetical protein
MENTTVLTLTIEKLITHWCVTRNQWVLQLSCPTVDNNIEVRKAAPCLKGSDAEELILRDTIFLPFNMERTARYAYDGIVGDDGPTDTNKYYGPCKILANLWNPKGECVNENT